VIFEQDKLSLMLQECVWGLIAAGWEVVVGDLERVCGIDGHYHGDSHPLALSSNVSTRLLG
jgi:hypothetical protein